MGARCYLATYRPLVLNSAGRQAADRYGLPPFVDGSCRREPDLESRFPSITATCRAGHFAPRLGCGDRIAYLTVKGRYLRSRDPSWRLVAVLRVVHRFESHQEAAIWYRNQGLCVPSNCVVPDNPPKQFEITNRNPPAEIKARISGPSDFERGIRLWDAGYRQRVAQWPVFLATEPDFLELYQPPEIREQDLMSIFGKVPGTLTPPAIAARQLDALTQRATGRAA